MQSLSKMSAQETTCGPYGQFRRRWLHGSLTSQASIRIPLMSPSTEEALTWKRKEGLEVKSNFFAVDTEAAQQVITLIVQDSPELTDVRNDHFFNSPSTTMSSAFPSTPRSDRPCLSANLVVPTPNFLPFASPLFSPLTPKTTPRTPFLETHSLGYRHKVRVSGWRAKLSRPGLLELDSSSQLSSPHFPQSATIPSPFRIQLRENVATTPLPSTPLNTPWWPDSGLQLSASRFPNQDLEFDGAVIQKIIVSNMPTTPSVRSSLNK